MNEITTTVNYLENELKIAKEYNDSKLVEALEIVISYIKDCNE